MQDGDRVRVRDGSTRLSFFAVRLSISHFRITVSTLIKVSKSENRFFRQNNFLYCIPSLADRSASYSLSRFAPDFAAIPLVQPAKSSRDWGEKDLGFKRE